MLFDAVQRRPMFIFCFSVVFPILSDGIKCLLVCLMLSSD